MKKRTINLATMAALVTVIIAPQAHAGLISEKNELQMGRDASKQIESQYKVSTDKQLTDKIVSMGKKIAAKSSRPKLDWQFKVLETKEVNALSVPGFIYVNRGLIDYCAGDTDALAGVISHEIAHTTARHAAKSAEKQLTYALAIQLFSKKGDGRKLGSVAANLALLGYSRKDEFQADKLGADYVYAAGYNPNGMIRFFRKLQQKEGKDSGGLSVYFRTHPPTADRIKRVGDEITRLGGRVDPVPAAEKPVTTSRGPIPDMVQALAVGA